MKPAETLMLMQLRSFLRGISETTDETVSETVLSDLLTLSAKHSVTPIVAETLFSCGLLEAGGVAEVYRQFSYKALIQGGQQEAELSKITELFEKNEIQNIPLKGSVLRAFYSEPWMRTSCDIDILIREEQLNQAIALLVTELNYTKENTTNHDILLVAPSGVHLELHFDMDEDGIDLAEVWETATPSKGNYQFAMTPELFVMHHISHMAKHFILGGCGIRTLLDLWLIQKNMVFDAKKLNQRLESASLLPFAKTVNDFLEAWFDGAAFNPLQLQLIEFVLKGGIYGSMDNSVVVKHSQKKNYFTYFFYRIFPKMRSMVYIYPILKKYPVLVPFFHIHRWICLIRPSKLKRAGKEIKNISGLSKTDLTEMDRFLHELGLRK